MANTSILAAFERMWQHTAVALSGKSDINHTHDDKYYTEFEMDTKLSNKADATHNHDSSYYGKTAGETLASTLAGVEENKADKSHTHTVTDITDLTVTATELNYMDGATSNIQTQIGALTNTVNGKANTSHNHDGSYDVKGAASSALTEANAYTDSAVDKKADKSHTHTVSNISDLSATATELNYMDGVTSNVQTQLDNMENMVDIKAGLKTKGVTYTDSDGTSRTCGIGSEVFNYYGEDIAINDSGYPDVGNLASGAYSHAQGYQTIASGYSSHAQGYQTIASGDSSHAQGDETIALGVGSHAEGCQTVAAGTYSHASGYQTIADSYQYVAGKYNEQKPAPASVNTQDTTHNDAIFVVGYGTSDTRANAFRITSGGRCRGASTFGASGADFAELFEWADGNPNNEDRRGLFVTLDGEKIRLANASDDYIGIISGAQAFVGNTASEEWQGKYLTDVFGTRLSQIVEIPEKINETTGEIIIPAHTTTQYIINPDYNPNEEYIMRENRKEWGTVGLLGQVVVIDDGTCTVGGYTKPLTNGIGTASDIGYRVMKRIDENHIIVLVK